VIRSKGSVLALCVLACATAQDVPAGRLLDGSIEAGHGIALTSRARGAANALAEVAGALEEGDVARADAALARARFSAPLADYVGLYEARISLAKQRPGEAVAIAKRARGAYVGSSALPQLAELRGDALAELGREAEARAEWFTTLDATEDLERRRELKLSIVASRQRSGELKADAPPEALLAEAFRDSASVLPSEVPAGERSPKMALAAADDLLGEGRGEQAILVYDEALASKAPADDASGALDEAERRHVRMQRGHALFRLRRYREAVEAFGGLRPEADARFWYARSLARAGRVSKAISEFEALVDEAPPEVASRSHYLAALLLLDRNGDERAMAHFERAAGYEQFPGRVAESLWRMGWWSFRRGDFAAAEERFSQMIEILEDPLDRLRPRYWAARSALDSKDKAHAKHGEKELRAIATDYPLSYYGWRAQERIGELYWLAKPAGDSSSDSSSDSESAAQPGGQATQVATAPVPLAGEVGSGPGSGPLRKAELVRIALLLEAGLRDAAAEELEPLARRASGRAETMQVGRLMVEAGDYYGAQRLVVSAYALPLSQGMLSGQERLWWLAWPPVYQDIIEGSLAPDRPVAPALVWSIMREESSFRPAVMSSAGAMGLLQLMPETARRTAARSGFGKFETEDLLTPETNIPLGAAYLEHLEGRFPGRVSAVIGSYNAGPLAVARWLKGGAAELEDDVWVEDIPYGQTKSYVKRVLRSFHVYRTFY